MTPSSALVSAALQAGAGLDAGPAQASGPAQWWEVLGALGPLAVFVGAITAAIIGGFTLRQRTRADALTLAQARESDARTLEQNRLADDRSEWWARAQWALDRALDDSPSSRALGLLTLEVLAQSKLAHTGELELFDVAWASLNRPDSSAADVRDAPANKPEGIAVPSRTLQVQVAAARLRVTLDRRLGRETPGQVQALAKELL